MQAGGEAISYAGEYETPEDMQGMPAEVDVRCLATLAPKEAARKGTTAHLQHPVMPDLPSGGEQPSSSEADGASPDLPEENMDGLAQTLVQALKDNPTVIRALLSSLSKEALAAAMGARDPAPHSSPSPPSSAPARPQEKPARTQPVQDQARSPRCAADGASALSGGGVEQGVVQEASQHPPAGRGEQPTAATQPMQNNRGQQVGPLRHVPGQPRWQPTAAIQSRGAVRPASAGAARTGANPQPAHLAEPGRPASANPTAPMPPGQLADLAATPQRMHRQALPPPAYQQPPQPRSASRRVPPVPAAAPHRPISHRAFQEEEREFEQRAFQERIMEERMAAARRTPPAHADRAPAAHADCTLVDAAVVEAGPPGPPHPEGEEGGEPFAVGSTANDVKPCKCKKSRCLKLYCDCFATGLFCNDACLCQDCENRTETLSAVFKARQFIMVKDPAAFKPKVTDATGGGTAHVKGCACRKSRCLKKYCECFLVGVRCTENCRCVACLNNGSGPEDIGAALVHGTAGALAAQPQQAPQAGAERHPASAAGPSAPRLPPRDRAPAPVGGPGSREFTVLARTGTADLPVTDDPMGGWGIPEHTHGSDAMGRPAGLSASLAGRTSLRRPGVPIWNSVGQHISTGRPTMAGTLLQQSMSELMTEVNGRTARHSRPERPSADAPQARQKQDFSDVPAANAEQGEEMMGDEGRFEEEDHREFDEEVGKMDLDEMGRRSGRAPEQAGADLAPQSAADNESRPMDNGPLIAPGHANQEIKSKDEDAVFAHPSQLALQEDIINLEQAERLAHAPNGNLSAQDANLTHRSRPLSPRNRNLGPRDADLGPRGHGPQRRDLDAHTRNASPQDRDIRPSGRERLQNHGCGRGNAHLDPYDREWVPGDERRGQRGAKLAQHGREQWHAEQPEQRDVDLRHRDISPHKRHRGEYLGPRDRDLSPHNRRKGEYLGPRDRDLSPHDRRNPRGYPGRHDSDLSSGRGIVQQLDHRDISVPHSRNQCDNRGVSPQHKKGRGEKARDEEWSPRDTTPDRARQRGRRGGKRERAAADPDPSFSGRSADGFLAEPIGRRARRASAEQEPLEEEGLGLRWGVRKKVTISRVPEAWRDQQGAQQVPSGGNCEEAELAEHSLPSRQRILNEMQQLGRDTNKRAAFPAPKPEEGTPLAGGAAPGPQPPPHRPTERLADTESDAAEALLSFL
ncbi:probable protein lin-54 at N-terminal half [Coccomyxa sp. Obi]|nr:probable protein lin-54 at N-terminal half [Coccomyxa sp. Obi]